MLFTLQKAINRQQVLDMIYMSSDGKFSQRTIKPYKVIDDHSVVAYCFLRQATRTFHIDHILALVPLRSFHHGVV